VSRALAISFGFLLVFHVIEPVLNLFELLFHLGTHALNIAVKALKQFRLTFLEVLLRLACSMLEALTIGHLGDQQVVLGRDPDCLLVQQVGVKGDKLGLLSVGLSLGVGMAVLVLDCGHRNGYYHSEEEDHVHKAYCYKQDSQKVCVKISCVILTDQHQKHVLEALHRGLTILGAL
jgi:hypothetical protein